MNTVATPHPNTRRLSLAKPVTLLRGFVFGRTFVDPVWATFFLIFFLLALLTPEQVASSVRFMGRTFILIIPFIVASAAIYGYAFASEAESLIAKALSGRAVLVVVTAALFGAMSPFCSCGVIPIVAALMAVGVPLAPVVAFWLASPVIDPVMFLLTGGLIDWHFAAWKIVGAISIGISGGFAVMALERFDLLRQPLKRSIKVNEGVLRETRAPFWKVWKSESRKAVFRERVLDMSFLLLKWLALAFLLESLMVRYVSPEWVTSTMGDVDGLPILWATLVGVPAYVNGYVALPLVSGLMSQGMLPGAAMAFLVAGGITSVPAMIAVIAVVRVPIVAFYVCFALLGSFAWGVFYQLLVS